MEFKHIPIMLDKCIDGLDIKEDGIYVDGTIGGAGHSSVICSHIKNGRLIGIDKDIEALNVCKERLKDYPFVTYVNDDFKNYKDIIESLGIQKVDGVLLDLGVSSYQIDNAERGFSFRFDARLDMRMNKTQELDAFAVVNSYSYEELVKILFTYGEEKFAKSIVRNIISEREKAPIETTKQLETIIKNSVPSKYKFGKKNPATKTFQAIRIEVNSELDKLEKCLNDMVESLNVGGRICVMTFHSLEDRIVKNTFGLLATDCICDKRLPICVCHHKASIKLINRKPSIADEEEQGLNRRSTCAKLRVIEKL